MLTTHWLSPGDLRALATGRGQAAVVRRLRAAELSKHRILLTALMREAARSHPAEYALTLVPAYRLLADLEHLGEKVVRDLVASPQFGSWVSDCVRRLTAAEAAGQRIDAPPLWIDLGQLAAFAGSAALLLDHRFEIGVPLRQGTVTFPGLGTASPGAEEPWEWGWVCLDSRGARLCSSAGQVRIPSGRWVPGSAESAWSPIPRLVAWSAGMRLDVLLDDCDPFLDRFGTPRAVVDGGQLSVWRRLLAQAWAILVSGHQSTATVVASLARTLVPLAKPAATRSASSTAAAAFGAIALSLPDDPLAMAESLTHESQHAVLNAVMDLSPMIGAGAESLTYAPWRDDPRPVGALLQGIYAHYGVARFWRRQRLRSTPGAAISRASVEFVRWRTLVAQAADTLADSGVLTEEGRELVSALRAELSQWQNEGVPRPACSYAEDLGIDHRVRWRLRNLIPDSAAIDSLAAAWFRRAQPSFPLAAIDVTIRQGPLPSAADNTRSYLLALRYRDPAGFRSWASRDVTTAGQDCGYQWLDHADIALAGGDHATAAEAYRRRIVAGADPAAWAGLAVARTHTGPIEVANVLTARPEVAAALYNHLRDGYQPDPDRVVAWLAQLDGTAAR
jgi:HEXXH motif-containing protein